MTPQLPRVPVFVIFLEERPRCAALCAALTSLEIPFEMVAATDVRGYDSDQLAALHDERRALRRVGRPMGRREIGCALSHREVYRRMLEKGIPLALVLEEDAVPGPNFKSFWQASNSLPEDIDILSLYSAEGAIRRTSSGSLAGCALHQATVMLAGTVGYYIRRDCALKLSQCNTPVSMVADWPLTLRSMRQFLVIPMLVEHPATGSTIADDRPRGNILYRYEAPRWFSGLFHLTYLGYLLQPQRYEGLSSYYHRQVAGRRVRIASLTQVDVRARLAQAHESSPPRNLTWIRSRVLVRLRALPRRMSNRVQRIAHSALDLATGREPLRRPRYFASAHATQALQKAKLKVGCYTNWLDFEDALRLMTPDSSGVWNEVAFVPGGTLPTDWIGIFNQPRRRALDLIGSPNRVFFAIGEPPTRMHRPLHIGQGRDTTVFTCDRQLAARSGQPRNYVLTPPMLRSWSVRRSLEQLANGSVRDKPRQLSWITSNVSFLPGHRRRLEFLARLRTELDFNLYGRGYERVHDKWQAVAPFRYSIAFENVRAPGYFSEKLMDCYVCETMPIYIGDPTITSFFPAESLMVIDPDAPDVIEQIRCCIASDAWTRNRDAILEAKRRVLYEYNIFAMLSQLLASRTEPASTPVKMRFTPVELASEDDAEARAAV